MSDQYLIRTRSPSGDLWWRPDGQGYTTQLLEAGVFTEEKAKNQARNREIDKAIPLRDALKGMRVSRAVLDAVQFYLFPGGQR